MAVINKLRIYSGLVLLLFVVGHLTHHVLGLVSIQAMVQARPLLLDPWRTDAGTALLLAALLVHASLAVWALYRRRNLRFQTWEAVQMILGFLIPILLVGHVLGTRAILENFDARPGFTYQLALFWVVRPDLGVIQILALITVWVHGALGIHTWLRLKPGYRRVQTYLFSLALLLPALAIAGFVSAGLGVQRRAEAEGWLGTLFARARVTPEIAAWVGETRNMLIFAWIAFIVLIFAARGLRNYLVGRKRVRIYYRSVGPSRMIDVAEGMTVLEALRSAGIRHASVCGGRGRCTTCRIQVDDGRDQLPPPETEEAKALARIRAPAGVRLACQVRPRRNVSVTPLLPPAALPEMGRRAPGYALGQERNVVILFADLRESTKLAEDRLPFDTVFILNQFFAEMAASLAETDGHYAQFNGDGLMAIYGLETDLPTAARQAIRGARVMLARLELLNERLKIELSQPLRLGIGIHAGEAIIGTMGPPATPIVSALGDNVNIAARLEAETKTFAAPIVLSVSVAAAAGLDLSGFAAHDVAIRGRDEPIRIHAIDDPARLPVPA